VLDKKYCYQIMEVAGKILKAEPNVNTVKEPSAKHSVVVVGDLHGSMVDLAEILELNGWPSESLTYVFNGDFVDRGDFGIEVLMSLFALKIIYPHAVYLNRGNHEDADICKAYGFYEEIQKKYESQPENLYKVVCDMFTLIPLGVLIEKTAFVVHGGLFRDSSVGLHEIQEIPRNQFETTLSPMRTDLGGKEQDYHEMLEDMTWSDPDDANDGTCFNSCRQAGTYYGADVARNFLSRLGIRCLVRSHECIFNGAEHMDCGLGFDLWTVFSASNYNGGNNFGAVLVFSSTIECPAVVQYNANPNSAMSLEQRNQLTLEDLIAQHKHLLLAAFEKTEGPSPSLVTPQQWAEVMRTITEVDINWLGLQPQLAPADAQGTIDYVAQLQSYQVGLDKYEHQLDPDTLVTLYRNHKKLLQVFSFLDTNQSGAVDEKEFLTGCDLLNLQSSQQMNGKEIFTMIDIDRSGEIDFNELCECFRVNDRQTSPMHQR